MSAVDGQRSADLEAENRRLRQELEQNAVIADSLRKSEALIRGMFETAVDAIITIDERGNMTSFNPAAERLFGYAVAEVIGKNISMLMPQPFQREHDRYLSRYLRTQEKRIIGIGREVIGQRKDGTTFPMDLAVGEQFAGDHRIFTGFVRDLTEHKRLEAEVLQIAEKQQQRTGQDLHDGLGQHLTGIAYLTKGLAGRLAAMGLPEAAAAEKINQLVNQAVSHTRALSRGLQPLLEASDLIGALEDLCESVRQVFCIDCGLSVGRDPELTSLTTATHLYRIAQEAVNNAIRHGKARCVAIRLDVTGDELKLTIEDDGGGFGPVAGTGIGLRTMQYRAKSIGGTLDIRPGDMSGVVVRCCLKLPSTTLPAPAPPKEDSK